MKISVKLATTVALLASLGGILSPPVGALDFAGILQNLSHGVSGWTELDARQNEITSQLATAAVSGQLTATEADGFKMELSRIQQVEFQIKASGRKLGAADAISFTNSLNNLTTRINLAITSKVTATATSLVSVESQRAQLNQQLLDARAAHTITLADASDIKHDLEHNANTQSAFTASGDGAVTARQAQVLSEGLARIKIALDQHLIIAQAGVPQLTSQRAAIEQMIASGLTAHTITDYQATDFRRELARIAYMQTNFLGADGALSANEVLALAGELDRLNSRIEYRISIALSQDDSYDGRGYGYRDHDHNRDDDRNGGNYRNGGDYGGGNGYGHRSYRQPSAHSLPQIHDRQAQLLTRINSAQNSRKLSRSESWRLRSEFDRIIQSETRLKAAGGGQLTYEESEKIWSDLTQLEKLVTTQIDSSSRRTAGSRQY